MYEMVCFHKPEEENGFLSNWFPSNFKVGKWEYSSMEQYMMHQKAHLFGDHEIASSILKASEPGTIKQLGRGVRGYNDKVWSGIRQIVVYRGLIEKFSQNEVLKGKLLATEGSMLAECAVQDKIWGIGLSMYDDRRFDIGNWPGQNLLGFALMEVRNSI